MEDARLAFANLLTFNMDGRVSCNAANVCAFLHSCVHPGVGVPCAALPRTQTLTLCTQARHHVRNVNAAYVDRIIGFVNRFYPPPPLTFTQPPTNNHPNNHSNPFDS